MSIEVILPAELGLSAPERFATGGMAELFTVDKVFPNQGHTRLVLKTILPGQQTVPELQSRFRDEARLGLTLRHGNIIRVLDHWEIDGQQYMTMEYVDGFDLAEVIRQCSIRGRQMPQEVAAYFVHGVASALAYMADARSPDGRPLDLVHRDTNPSNILVSRSGHLKLIDFGVAKVSQRETRTLPGHFVGKTLYMSPEQLEGKDPDIRSDLFSLGVVGYEMLAGAHPFRSDSSLETMRMIQAGQPDPLEQAIPGINPLLNGAIRNCMAKSPDDRYDHPLGLVRELDYYFFVAVDRPPQQLASEFLRDIGLADAPHERAAAGIPTRAVGNATAGAQRLEAPPAPQTATSHPSRANLWLGGAALAVAVVALLLVVVWGTGRMDRDGGGTIEGRAGSVASPDIEIEDAPTAQAHPGVAEGAPTKDEDAEEPAATHEPALQTGTLAVHAIPWVEVTIDGRSAGRTPIEGLSLTEGAHRVTATSPVLGWSRTETVHIAAGEQAEVRFKPESP